ncbi:Sterile alpha motif domain-containing protein 15 [Taenia solium]|eukprot:TsM_000190400 transcript=TsM_000190400 gene=TsM_000190400
MPRLIHCWTMLEEIPEAYYWSEEKVADWIESLGYPHYRECFTQNHIDGRRLILVDASTLPKMGIQKFKDIKIITSSIRKLLNLGLPEPRLFLEMKLIGNPVANHSIPRFKQETEDRVFPTDLTNMGLAFAYPGFDPTMPDYVHSKLCPCEFAGSCKRECPNIHE